MIFLGKLKTKQMKDSVTNLDLDKFDKVSKLIRKKSLASNLIETVLCPSDFSDLEIVTIIHDVSSKKKKKSRRRTIHYLDSLASDAIVKI